MPAATLAVVVGAIAGTGRACLNSPVTTAAGQNGW